LKEEELHFLYEYVCEEVELEEDVEEDIAH
jgi:hypothetical protein